MKISKKMLSIMIGGVLIASCTTMVLSDRENLNSGKSNASVGKKQSFACPGPTDKVDIEYLNGGEKIRLTDYFGDTHELRLSKSASGSYYENERDSFHIKGNEAVFEFDNRTFTCTRMQ